MKSFEDFYTATSDKLDAAFSEVIQDELTSQQHMSPAELLAKIVQINRIITYDTLREYHNWLSEQLGE